MILFLIEYLCLLFSFSFFIFCNYKVIKDYSSYFFVLSIILSLKWFIRGFPDSSVGKESACSAGDPISIPGLGRSTGEGIGYPLQYSWASLVAQLVKNPPAMWETGFSPWVGKILWRRERLPTPVFWPGEIHGLYSLWGHKELDTTERLSLKKEKWFISTIINVTDIYQHLINL